MPRDILFVGLVLFLAGCAPTEPPVTETAVEAHARLAGPGDPGFRVTEKPRAPLAMAGEPRREGDLLRYYAHPGASYLIRTAPLRATALQLRPDDTDVRVFGGDTERWDIALVEAGGRATVIIKPLAWRLQTNIQVATSEGLLSFDLRTSTTPDDIVMIVPWPAEVEP